MTGRRETGRGMSRKNRDVYAVITDFSLQYQRSEKTGTELGMDRQRRCRTPMTPNRRGRSHTKWRDRPTAWEAVRSALAPVPAELGRGCARASSLRRMPRCTLIATVPALRCAPRRGHLGDECAAMAYTCARSTRLEHVQALPRKAHAAILLAPGPGGAGGSMAGIRHLGRGGLCGAVRHGAGCRSAWRPLEPPRAQGARYALGEGTSRLGGVGFTWSGSG